MAKAGDVAAALARLGTGHDHDLIPFGMDCQRCADLALLAQAAQAGGEECVECVAKQFRIDVLQESIDGCAKRVAALRGARARVIEECAAMLERRVTEHEDIAVKLITADRRSEMALTHKSMAHTYASAAQQIRALLTPGEGRGA